MNEKDYAETWDKGFRWGLFTGVLIMLLAVIFGVFLT